MERKGYEKRSYQKRRRRRYWRKVLFTFLIMAVFAFGVGIFCYLSLEQQSFTSLVAESDKEEKENLNGSISDIEVDLKYLYSPYAILVDLASGNCLAERDAQVRIYPASLTKIMTAVLAIENTADMRKLLHSPQIFFNNCI